MKKPVAHAVV